MTLIIQVTVSALMMLTGLVLGLWFDLYRFINRRGRGRVPLASILDILFWAVITAGVLVILMVVNHLELRLYVFLSMGLGFFLYLRLLSALVMKTYTKALALLSRTLGLLVRVLKPVTYPLRLAGALTDNLAILMLNGVAWIKIKLSFNIFQQEKTPPM